MKKSTIHYEREQVLRLGHGSVTSHLIGNYDRPTEQPTDGQTWSKGGYT